MKEIIILIFVLITLLCACGGGGSGNQGSSSPAVSYGTLALSGGGTSITGTQFQATHSTYAAGTSTGNQYAWVANDGKALTVTDFGGGYASIEFDWDTGNKSYMWYNTYTTGVTVGASSVTLNNITISGHLNTTSSLNLNGTLNY